MRGEILLSGEVQEFEVQELGSRVQGSGFRFQGLGRGAQERGADQFCQVISKGSRFGGSGFRCQV